MFYLRWETVFWVWQQCHFQSLSTVTAVSLVASFPCMAPAWKGRVDYDICNQHGHCQHHPCPLSSLRASCFLLLPLPPPTSTPPLPNQWLSPTEDKIQGESRWPRAVAEGSFKAHLSFCLAIGICIFLSCSQLSPRVWSRVTAVDISSIRGIASISWVGPELWRIFTCSIK